MNIRLMYVAIRKTAAGQALLDFVFDTGKVDAAQKPIRYHQSSDVEQRMIGEAPLLAQDAEGYLRLTETTTPDGNKSQGVALANRFTAKVDDANVVIEPEGAGKTSFAHAKPGLGWSAMKDVEIVLSAFVTTAAKLPGVPAAAPAAAQV